MTQVILSPLKKNLYYFLIIPMLWLSPAHPQGSGVSLGFALSDGPALLTSKFWLANNFALDVAGTFNFEDQNNWVYFHSNILMHNFSIVTPEEGKFPLYWGGGIKTTLGDNYAIGIRTPFGASYIGKNSSFETFFEIAPFFDVVKTTRLSLGGAIGFRLYL